MKKIFYTYILLFLFLGSGPVFADEQNSAQQTSCEKDLDISTLPLNTPFIKTDLSDLEDYFTCKAAVKEDVQICNIFPDDSPLRANCQEAYSKYYETMGKLYKNGRGSDEFSEGCIKIFKSKKACDQVGEILLSGNSNNCQYVDGITPENIVACKEMTSSNPKGGKAFFMMALRKGDLTLCDLIPYWKDPSSVRAICKGLLSKNADGCQLNAGVRNFKKLYCQDSATKEYAHGTKKE